jgi:hypothetical protein
MYVVLGVVRDRPPISAAVLALAAMLATGCSREKSISRDEAQSEIRSAQSLAAESELFINFVIQGHSRQHYAEEHADYLEKLAADSAKDLAGATAEPDAEEYVRTCRAGLDALRHELSGLRAAITYGDNDAIAAARGRIAQIRERLEKAKERP